MLNEAFKKVKSNLELNESFDKEIQQKHKAVRSAIQNINPNINTKLIGSLQRKTRIQPKPDEIFDIDILVILGEFTGWVSSGGIIPQEAIQILDDTVEQSERYSSMNPQVDEPTVKLEYSNNIEVEFVPAYIDKIGHSPNGIQHTPVGRGYWVPKNNSWELADYDYDAEYFTQLNQISDELLVPTAKMLKAIKRIHFPAMNSFHLEILSTHIIPSIIGYFKENNIPITYPNLINNFFSLGKDYLLKPIKMVGSNSPHTQLDYLERDDVIKAFESVGNYCDSLNNISNDRDAIDGWRNLFGDAMPLS